MFIKRAERTVGLSWLPQRRILRRLAVAARTGSETGVCADLQY
jgi:hypothetical protein